MADHTPSPMTERRDNKGEGKAAIAAPVLLLVCRQFGANLWLSGPVVNGHHRKLNPGLSKLVYLRQVL